MLLFVDETENDSLFIVGGILLDSRESAAEAYRRFKRKIRNYPLTENKRMKLYTEFKSVLMDNHYQRIKLRMIEEISEMESCIIYSCYIKKEDSFLQSLKDEDRRIFLCRFFANMEYKEIAKKYGYTQSRVKMSVQRSKKKLKEQLINEGYYNEKQY